MQHLAVTQLSEHIRLTRQRTTAETQLLRSPNATGEKMLAVEEV